MTMNQNADGASGTAGATVTGFGLSYAITSLFSALVVILKESSEGFHDALASLTGHHWVSHGVLDIVVFVVLGVVLSRTSAAQMSARTLVTAVVGSTVLSGLIIAGYFV